MALIQSVGKSTFNTAAPVTVTAGSNFAGTNAVIVVLEYFSATPNNQFVSVTVAGTSAVRRAAAPALSGSAQVEIWDCLTNAGGSAAVIITGDGTNIHTGFASVLEWSGVTGFDQANSNNPAASTSPSVSTSGSTSQANELLIAVSGNSTGGTIAYTSPSGWTNLGVETSGATADAGSVDYFVDTGAAGTKTATWTTDTSNITANAIATYTLASSGPTSGVIIPPTEWPGKSPHGAAAFPQFRQGIPAANNPATARPAPFKQLTVHPGAGPQAPMRFPTFRQGVRAANNPATAAWGASFITNEGPGRGPGPRVFPAFVKGIAPANSDVTLALTGVLGDTTAGPGSVTATVSPALTGVAADTTAGVGTVTASTGQQAALTGVAATGAVGTLAPTVSPALTGVAATGAVGTLAPTVSPALTGVAATGSPGTLAPTISPALTGVAATGAVGTVTASTGQQAALTGVAATGSPGTLAPTISPALTGVAATGAVGTLAPTVSPALTGVAATGAVGTAAPTITHALTGTVATGSPGTVAVAGTGSGANAAYLPSVGQVLQSNPNRQAQLSGVAATGAAGTPVYFAPGGSDAAYLPSMSLLLGPSGNKTVGLSGVTGTASPGSVVSSGANGAPIEGSRRRPMGLNPGALPYNLRKFYHSVRNTQLVLNNATNVSLTGVTGTGSVGTPVAAPLLPLLGNQATTAPGTIIPVQGTVQPLTGVTATGSPGTMGATAVNGALNYGSRRRAITLNPGVTPYNLAKFFRPGRGSIIVITPNAVVPLNGVAATGTVNSPGVTMSVPLPAGATATAAVGFVTNGPAKQVALTGVGAFTGLGVLTPTVSPGITTVRATGTASSVRAVSGAVAALSGLKATASVGIVLATGYSSVALSGVRATVNVGTMQGVRSGVWEPEDQGGGGPWQKVPRPGSIWQPVDKTENPAWKPER